MESSIQTDVVGSALEDYAERGVFRGFSRSGLHKGKEHFKLMWHRDQMFELIADPEKKTLRFPMVLPSVPDDIGMYDAFKVYLKDRQSDTLPDHRRIDPARAEIRSVNRGGNVSLTLKVKDDDFEYGTRKLINLVHEIYLDFLSDGLYYDYLVETFNLDPDSL
ncbi:MAG: hypothetical protein COA73_09830 [Candidatus Hydrogenedentota bacterium]|nr:MAG: hypothetical protein COA73_09830 [Candidatus Hydrogenedentota bacterium]